MIILDHDIPEHQVESLRLARLRPQQIGRDIGRPEWQDLEEILRYLHSRKSETFFTRDEGFFRRQLCHQNYCIVFISGSVLETSLYIQRFLRHRTFRTRKSRMGKVIRLSSTRIVCWERGKEKPLRLAW